MSLVITGQSLITTAFQTLGVYAPQDTPSAEDTETALFVLQELIDSWVIENLTWLTTDRHVYPLVAGQGGLPDIAPTSSPYTLGPGGNFDTGTLPRPAEIDAANLLLVLPNQTTRIPLSIMTDMAYFSQPVPELSTQLPTALYYNPTDPLGQVYLWPVPDTSANSLELLFGTQTATFASLNVAYTAPPGYAKAFRLELSKALIPFFAVPPTRTTVVLAQAEEAMASLKAKNVKMSDLSIDPMFLQTGGGPLGASYDIFTDTGG